MQLSQEELENLSSLLLSVDDSNTQIAFEILDVQNFPKELFTEAFVVFKLSENDELKRKAAAFLYQQGSSTVTKIMGKDLRLAAKGHVVPTEQTIKKNIDTYVQLSGGELDGLKMALAMYNKYGVGLNYLLDRLSPNLKKNLLKTFINGSSFKLNGRALSKVPPELYDFVELTEIDLSHNKIKTIPAQIKAFKNLKSLNVSNNILTSLNKALESLPKLSRLDISENKFTEFPEIVCHLKELEYLNIETLNHLIIGETIPVPTAFHQLKNLKEILACRGNYGYSQGVGINLKDYPNFTKLTSINGESLNLDPLVLAEFAYNQNGRSEGVLYLFKHSKNKALIKRVIEEQFYFPKEKTLDLKESMLLNLPSEIGDYDIEHLNFQGCYLGIEHYVSGTKNTYRNWALLSLEEIDTLMAVLKKFPNIKSADLAHNRLGEIPSVVFDWKQLRKLDLSQNALTNLPTTINQLQQLEDLSLYGNKLTALPKELFELKNLKKLSLGNNSFKAIPEELGQLSQLEELHFNSCLTSDYGDKTIFEIPGSFAQLQKLKHLHFYEARLYYDKEGFKEIYKKRLEELLPKDCIISMQY